MIRGRRRLLLAVASARRYGSIGNSSRAAIARLTPLQRELVEREHGGHVGASGGFATGKSTVAAERVLWLDGRDRKVLALSGRLTDQSALVRYADEATTFHALERRGHRVAGVMEWTQQTMEELGFSPDGQRVLSFGQLTAFLMHHAHVLPLRVLHQRLATASSMQLRRTVADTQRFFTTLEVHGVYPEVYTEYASTRAAETGNDDQLELAHAYRVYRELLRRHDLRSWDGLALDLRQLFERDPHCLLAATNEFSDVVVDDLDRMTPTMVHTLGLVLQQPHIQSSLSLSHTVRSEDCPQTSQLHQLLAGLNPQSILLPMDSSPGSKDRRGIHIVAARVLSSSSVVDALPTDDEVPVTSLQFDSFDDEASFLASLIKQKLTESPSGSSPRITVFCPTKADVSSASQAFLAAGLSVNGRRAVNTPRRHLFDEPGVDALFSLLVALWMPSDTKHLYNVLRSEFFTFPAEVLSRIMEKQHRRSSHATLVDVLSEFVESKGQTIKGVGDASIVEALTAAENFLTTVKECREQCHSKSVSDIVQLFLERTGHLESLLDPQTPRAARQAIALAAFLKEIDSAQRVVQSAHVPFIVPYLLQLHSARVAIIEEEEESDNRGSDINGVGTVRVLLLTRYELDQFEVSRQADGGSDEDLVILMAMRDAKFPGRLKRITWPLPMELLSKPLPVQTRAEFLVEAEELVHDALVQLNAREVVVSFAKSVGGSSSKRSEKLSRVLEPLWTEPPPMPEPTGPLSFQSSPSQSSDFAKPSTQPAAVKTGSFEPTHLSYSQITEYTRCPHKYYLSRVLGLRDFSDDAGASNLAMMFGSAVHEAIAAFSAAIQKGKTVEHSEHEALDALRSAWRREGFLSKRQEAFFAERAETTLRGWLQRHLPTSEIVAVEQDFECRLGSNWDVPLRGVWDRVDRTEDGKIIIREFKTNPSALRRTNLDVAAAESLQLQIYMVAFEQIHGEAPHGATLEVLGDEVNAGFVAYSPDLRQRVDDAVDAAMQAIRRGEFPARPGFMECGMCPYASSACRANVAPDDELADGDVVTTAA